MADRSQFEELARQLSAIGTVKRELARHLPGDCAPGSAAVLALLGKFGEMRLSRLAELMGIDLSVTSRHVAHVAERGWIERYPDPQDGRSRLLRVSPAGQELLTEMSARTAEVLQTYLHDWTDDDVAQLVTLFARLRASFGDCRAHGARATAHAVAETDATQERL
ncbi:MarR family winged helix-turn-helix transcriptional regulator [Streptomyces xiaopingdaonensis]|uniref:MarR family winged helix-turn-helix transcriptional regulator n=1 Tax=Streptomyces xiaopingdaonensis TaxID=1565415 RepID=UPI0002D8CD1D|nr:MarR family transcriptional regulator [Streptomyces xiaopingdaonensis]